MTDFEIDVVLARYDQTAPDLQRKIVARLVEKLVAEQETNAELRKTIDQLADRVATQAELLERRAERK